MTERIRSATTGYPGPNNVVKMENDLGPRKTMLVLVIVVGCFAVLWPKVFYPMLVGSANQHIKPSPIDKTTGCCDVISETDVNTIKILSELCGTIIQSDRNNNKPLTGKELVQRCRQEILDTCGIDIAAVLQEQVRLGQNVKQILDEIRSLNGSLCLKYNFGVAPWKLGVPHRITVKVAPSSNIRQERPLHLRSELIHPAFRERGRAIPQAQTAPQSPARPPPRVLEGRPGPIPGMRPTIGGAGHVVPPSKQGTSSMSIIMPIYTIGIVIFFTYTLMKIIFKKQPESVGGTLYPPVEPDPNFRKQVFDSERTRLGPKLTRENISSKLGWMERDARDVELDQLRHRLRETELAMERIVEQMSKVPLKAQDLANGTLSSKDASKSQVEEQPTVKVLGMEMTASCEGGKKWSRPESPVLSPSPVPVVPKSEPVSPPQEIYLEGALPPQSHLLVSESATESERAQGEDPAVVLSGKMTLSLVSLDASDNGNEIEDETVQTKIELKDETESIDQNQEQKNEESLEKQREVQFVQNKLEIPELESEVNNLIQEAVEIATEQTIDDNYSNDETDNIENSIGKDITDKIVKKVNFNDDEDEGKSIQEIKDEEAKIQIFEIDNDNEIKETQVFKDEVVKEIENKKEERDEDAEKVEKEKEEEEEEEEEEGEEVEEEEIEIEVTDEEVEVEEIEEEIEEEEEVEVDEENDDDVLENKQNGGLSLHASNGSNKKINAASLNGRSSDVDDDEEEEITEEEIEEEEEELED